MELGPFDVRGWIARAVRCDRHDLVLTRMPTVDAFGTYELGDRQVLVALTRNSTLSRPERQWILTIEVEPLQFEEVEVDHDRDLVW